ncbi:MAG: hypothetical protein ACRERR_04505 [Moraxellaceae bacterium]
MRIADSLLALERATEKALLGFFVLLGAGAAPENWQPVMQEAKIKPEYREAFREPR